MGSGAAAKKHFQDTEGRADSEKRVVCLGGTRVHGGGRVVGSRGAGGARAGMGQGSCRAQARLPAWGGLEAARAQRAWKGTTEGEKLNSGTQSLCSFCPAAHWAG